MRGTAADFGAWLVREAPQMQFDFFFKQFPALPPRVTGLENVLGHYRWRSSLQSGDGAELKALDWSSTKLLLRKLSADLQDALDRRDDETLLRVCQQVIRWGGGARSQGKGASAFLQRKHEEGRLSSYIGKTAAVLALRESDSGEWKAVEQMNSMLTKIHAFASTDGLPIYDSRVAGAAGALADLFCRREGRRLDEDIRFPALQERRSALALGGEAPPMLRYGSVNLAPRWAAAKVRLGRLMQHVIANSELFAAEGDRRARMHALEATLFVIGYDPACLKPNLSRS